MSGGGGAAEVASSGGDIPRISPETHLFFDDKQEFISQVDDAVTKYNSRHTKSPISLQSIFCPPGQVVLVDSSTKTHIRVKGTVDETTGRDYSTVKIENIGGEISFTEHFGQKENIAKNIGNGITIDMIHKIIEVESNPEQHRDCNYFFDLDLTLSLVAGLDFGFTKDPKIITSSSLTYAKYLFSNYTGEEPDGASNGRFAKLKEMFTRIGDPSRVYVITSNQNASIIRSKRDGTPGVNPYRTHVVELLHHLLPGFIPEHLICSYSKNPVGQNNKGDIIVKILDNERKPRDEQQPLQELFKYGGTRRITHRKPKRKSSSSSRYKRRRYSKKSKK